MTAPDQGSITVNSRTAQPSEHLITGPRPTFLGARAASLPAPRALTQLTSKKAGLGPVINMTLHCNYDRGSQVMICGPTYGQPPRCPAIRVGNERMTEAESIAAWRQRALLRLVEAQRTGAPAAAQEIVDDLVNVHLALGERRTGTSEEQRTYLLARSTRTPLPELAAVGIDTNDWPPPPRSSPALAEPTPASPGTEERIKHFFASAGPLADRRPPPARYEVRFLPEDGQRYREHPLPWAIWDTQEGQALAYHGDKDLAEYQAGQASEKAAAKKGRAA